MNGALVVDKPGGPTSHDVVAAVRRVTGVRRIGHTGTLDPMATGVLVLLFGQATRLSRFLTTHVKTYEASIRLGLTTDTYDITGKLAGDPTEVRPVETAEIRQALQVFVGAFEQTPPPYSAKKIDGVRAHRLARRQRPMALPPVRVVVHELELIEHTPDRVRIRLTCSAGFYVRSLAHALGMRLGIGACLETLRRTRIGPFSLDAAKTLEWICQAGPGAVEHLIPMDRVVGDLAGVTLTELGARRAAHGNAIGTEHLVERIDTARLPPDAMVRLLDLEGTLVGVARAGPEPGTLRPAVVLV